MITITHDGSGGFQMKFSAPGTGWRGYAVKARTVKEVQVAVEHYLQAHGGRRVNCPLCRRMREEDRKARKKKPAPRRTR